jgi:hypothetical protein
MKEVEIFKLPTDSYTSTLDPLRGRLISKVKNMPIRDSKELVTTTIKNNKNKVNPNVKYRKRTESGDREVVVGTLRDYLRDTINEGEIIVPSFTTYDNPKKNKSLHSEFISGNIVKRSKHKKKAAICKADGDHDGEIFNDCLQKTMKIFNNSLSGSYGSNGTILYNPSAHYTLTSITRCMASIGNAISESLIASNKYFKQPDTVFNYITSIIDSYDLKYVRTVVNKFKLYVPTPEDVMKMILKSSRLYWQNDEIEFEIYTLLRKLTKADLVMIMYTNDLFQLKECNQDLVKDFVTRTSNQYEIKDLENPIEVIENVESYIMNLVHHTCADVIKGKKTNYKNAYEGIEDGNNITKEDLIILASTAKRVQEAFDEYREIFKLFFVTKIMPIDIANIKDMLREVIVLSDTDSTCATYQLWVEWYFGKMSFGQNATSVAAVVMTINTQVIDHYLKLLAANMNVEGDMTKALEMKNEFFWDVFVNNDNTKHYFSNVVIKEGSVFKEAELEIKGVHLIASKVPAEIRAVANELFKDILHKAGNGIPLVIEEYVQKVIDVEQSIVDRLKSKDVTVLAYSKVKDKKAYKKPESSPYLHYELWCDVFEDKYGACDKPEYTAVKIPTTLDKAKVMVDYLNNLEDTELADRYRRFLDKKKKTNITVLLLPMMNLVNNGIPEELLPVLDYDKVIMDNCKVLYLILNSLNIYIPDGTTYSNYFGKNMTSKNI